jgi:hypothetical protein
MAREEGGRRPTTLLTNLLSPRSILTWIVWEPPDRGLCSPGEMMSSRMCSVVGKGERRVPIWPRASRTDLERWTRSPRTFCDIAARGLTLASGLWPDTRVGEDFAVAQVAVAVLSLGWESLGGTGGGFGVMAAWLSTNLVRSFSRQVLKSSRMITSVRALKTNASFQ